MWEYESINRIASTLGAPISAKVGNVPNPHSKSPPPLELCITITKEFRYRERIMMRLEGEKIMLRVS